MKLLFKNHLENAIEALRANRLRTALTIIGVTIGIASITAILSLADGATRFFHYQTAEVSDSIAIIRSNQTRSTPGNLLSDFNSLHNTTTLTEQDVKDLTQIANATTAPLAILHTGMKTKGDSVDGQHAALVGTNTQLLPVANLELFDGQFLPSDTNVSGVVMGHQLAIDLFGTEYAIGNILKIRGENFTVIGILKPTNQPMNYLGINFDQTAIVSLSGLKQFTQKVPQIQQIIIKSDEKQPLEPIVAEADKTLSKNHHEEPDFVILTGQEITKPNSQLFANFSITIALIAGIALLVGGIGIMNIMLVNVAERNREVGIRKAIGATDGNIINQFLIESAIIGLLGGIAGYIFGLAAAFALSIYLPFMPEITWQVAVISVGIALFTGIVFGVYPAYRAAKKDPIVSLRQ